MFKVISFNANGIRSAAKKGFFDWVLKENPDWICLQETKANRSDLPEAITALPGYEAYFSDAIKKGYSGVAIYTKKKPIAVTHCLDLAYADTEGRFVMLEFETLRIASLYFPSGSAGEARQNIKFQFLKDVLPKLKAWLKAGKSCILCGDWNIAHTKLDIKNWRANQTHSGFLPEERAWLDEVFALGYQDAFRLLNHNADEYTWWSMRGKAREKNVGWRIDYQIITPDLKNAVKSVEIYREQNFSDHAPVVVEYNFIF